MFVPQKEAGKTPRQEGRDLRQIHHHAGPGGAFHFEFVAEIVMESL